MQGPNWVARAPSAAAGQGAEKEPFSLPLAWGSSLVGCTYARRTSYSRFAACTATVSVLRLAAEELLHAATCNSSPTQSNCGMSTSAVPRLLSVKRQQ